MLYNQPSAFWWCDLYLVLARPIATVPQLRHTHYEHIKVHLYPVFVYRNPENHSFFFGDSVWLDGQCMKILGCTQYSVPFRIAPRKGECVSKECLTLSNVFSEEHPENHTHVSFSDIHSGMGRVAV